MLKPRKLTLAMARDVLKMSDRPLSDEELAARLECSPVTIREHLAQWACIASGVRCVRRGAKQYIGWSYVPPEDAGGYEPVTPTIEQLQARISELEVEVTRLKAASPLRS